MIFYTLAKYYRAIKLWFGNLILENNNAGFRQTEVMYVIYPALTKYANY